MLSVVKRIKWLLAVKNTYLPHVESIIAKILRRRKECSASEIAEEVYPGHTSGELRPKISQISVSLKRLKKKSIVKGEKRGRKNFFRLVK
jgi:predicted transcriptional regulator